MQGKPRILGVDDSLTIRKALEIVLRPAGYELDLAVDGADALAKAKAFKPSLILLDFILPDMRGSEVCQQLAADPETSQIPIILISAKGAEIRQAYRDAHNVVSYIAKPFKPQVITGIVADVLARAAAGTLVKSAVPVHEAEGAMVESISIAPPPSTSGDWPAPPVQVVTAQQTPAAAGVPPPAETRVAWKTIPASPITTTPEIEPHTSRQAAAAAEAEEPRFRATPPSGRLLPAAGHETLDLLFETLRASIEGVYVEEVDTPLGAAADQAKSYTDLLEALTRELAEGLRHARSGSRFSMYGDGSVRSLDDSLLEIFRRSCRLLFRAATSGALTQESPPARERVLIVCQKNSPVHRQIPALVAVHPEWQVFTISEGFRQIPMIAQLYGPTRIIAEVTWSGALWDQLRILRQMPESSGQTCIGITSPERPRPEQLHATACEAALQERGISRLVGSVFELDPTPTAPAQRETADVSIPESAPEQAVNA